MKDELEEFIDNNRDRFDRETPNPKVLNRILEQMQAKEKPRAGGILISFQALRWAAVIFTLIACGVAFLMLQKKPEPIAKINIKTSDQQQLTKLKNNHLQLAEPVAIIEAKKQKSAGTRLVEQDLKERKRALFAGLKAQTLHTNKQVIFAALNDMSSPASRITAASRTYKLTNTGNDIVDALVETLDTDPNANVRLAALDGLGRFYRDDYVRKKLLVSLKKQQDPVVQIALINLLTSIRELGILEELEKIVNDENTQKIVKDCAYSSIIRLRSS